MLLAALLSATLAQPIDSASVDYQRDIRPILARHCFACHGNDADHRKAGLRLDTRDGATASLASGATAIVPGNPEASDLLFRINEPDPTVRMPPPKAGNPLKPEEVALLRTWIEQGAPYAEHWAFLPPTRPNLPNTHLQDHARSAIDHFIQHRLVQAELEPAPEADPHTLIRRLSLDLRGLPPTPEEAAAFAADPRPDAYNRLVDRYLADPAFGERWARLWLDLARYADSAGFGSDPLRPHMWRYRDWIIDAFNQNLPYDQFIIEQLAGDLLPNPTLDQKVATAFHRNTMTNTEGGTDDEEFRTAAIKDRVDTTGLVFMGLTFGCAKCHSHKYDPISNHDYYRLYAFFNQSQDNDQPDEQPTLPAPTRALQLASDDINRQLADLHARLDTPTPELAAAQTAWETELSRPIAWTLLAPDQLESQAGATLTYELDGVIRVDGPTPQHDRYTIAANLPPMAIAALRLETLPDESLPAAGAGRAPDGNFVLSRVSATLQPNNTAAPIAKTLKITLAGERRILSLAEVEVFQGETNLSRAGTATQSSTAFDGPPERALDGNTNGHYFEANSTTHTAEEPNPWWQVTLAQTAPIDRIVIWNRTDGGLESRLAGARVDLLDEHGNTVWTADLPEPPRPSSTLSPSGKTPIRFTRAIADHSQHGFPADAVLKPAADPTTGWAVAPRIKQPHSLTLLTDTPLDQSNSTRLIITLEHQFKDPGFTLGRFRLAISGDPEAARRASLPSDILATLDTRPDKRTHAQSKALARYYRSIAPLLQPVRDQIAALEQSKPKPPRLPVMQDLPADKRRVTRILNKGNFLDPGAEVTAGVPTAFGSLPPGVPDNRLGLARWLVAPSNPLTARVAANRIWAQLFGTGIVETEEDFGTQGALPSHPELLDWLALELVESDWNLKSLVRTIATSATYKQSSTSTPRTLERDPRNRLLARAPRIRLEAELVRDQALALSGLLCRKIGGPSVYPPQPDGLWQAAFNGERTWPTSSGPDRYRRGLYTFWRRTVPYPSMATFDAPSRETCTVKRIRTNTPLQAFVTLNDPAFVEAAQALARRIARKGGTTTKDRVKFGLTLALGRPPDPMQIDVLINLYQSELAYYQAHPDQAAARAADPLGPLAPADNPAELAAWTSVASVLLNLDSVLTRG